MESSFQTDLVDLFCEMTYDERIGALCIMTRIKQFLEKFPKQPLQTVSTVWDTVCTIHSIMIGHISELEEIVVQN